MVTKQERVVARVGIRIGAPGCMVAALLAGAVQAATLSPADVGGAYSSNYASPTQIGSSFDTILGTATAGQNIELELTSLPAGAQTLTFAFSTPAGISQQGPANGWSYFGAGGSLLYSVGSPFAYGPWGGTSLGSFGVANSTAGQMTQTLTLALGPSFSGPLYLGLNMTYGNTPVTYSIGVPSNAVVAAISVAPPAPVPVPPGGLLIGAALGGLWLLRRRRGAA